MILRSLYLIIYLGLCLRSALPLQAIQLLSSEQAILQEVQILPHEGVLKENPDGFIYIKVDDRYIHHLFPLIELENFQKPPYFRRFDSPGAHISVFYTNESQQIGSIQEIGQTYSFELKEIKEVRSGQNLYLILEVDAPELEKLREKYGFSSKLQSHEFHITLAQKKI